jgi:predicted nucleic acid-binding Zn ribbon protein
MKTEIKAQWINGRYVLGVKEIDVIVKTKRTKKQYLHKCIVCKKKYWSRIDKYTCSNKCRQKNYRLDKEID